jgi:2-dehydro-3-deoxy-D-gluconate 5-dehydrogenase
MFDLTGKVALVTGGNGGIGLGMALGLARAGARVVVAGRDARKSAGAVEQLQALGSDAFALEVDVSDEASVQAMVDQAVQRCARLDILINNAGINIRQPADKATLTDWHSVIDTNLTSAFLCARAAYPHLKRPSHASAGGKVINIGSMTSIFGAPFAAAYCASKGGVVQFTMSIASAWAVDNIQCNAILPGWIDTDLTRQACIEVKGLNENILARTPARRWGRASDLAGTAVFLASSASDFVTGTAIPVDGGYSIQA